MADIININSISDKDQLTIFLYVPISDLPKLELVCKRWRDFVFMVYGDQRQLRLLQDPAYKTELKEISRFWYFNDYRTLVPFEETCFAVKSPINSDAVKWLVTRFRNVRSLSLYCVKHSVSVKHRVNVRIKWGWREGIAERRASSTIEVELRFFVESRQSETADGDGLLQCCSRESERLTDAWQRCRLSAEVVFTSFCKTVPHKPLCLVRVACCLFLRCWFCFLKPNHGEPEIIGAGSQGSS